MIVNCYIKIKSLLMSPIVDTLYTITVYICYIYIERENFTIYTLIHYPHFKLDLFENYL